VQKCTGAFCYGAAPEQGTLMQEDGIDAGIGVLRQRERIAVFAMVAVMAISALTAVFEVMEIGGIVDLVQEPDAPLSLVYVGVLLSNFVIYIGAVIAVAMWIHRGHRNLHEAGIPDLRFSPGWAVGWYFVPIAFLFMPFQAMRELWTVSHNRSDSFSASAPGNLGMWWAFWIIGNILGNVSFRMSDVGDGSVALVTGLGSSIGTIVAAWLLMRIMQDITAAQADGIGVAQIFE
jgi:hypothetical protein